MNRISHIVVVVDPLVRGRQSAVDKAASLALCFHASVELLICDIESAHNDDIVVRRAREPSASNTQLLDLLDQLGAPLRAQKIDVTERIIYGTSLHESLLEYLRGSTAGLVVKSTHHHSLARRTVLRNTDSHLVHGCPVPLLLTKAKEWHRPPVIMAAVDANQESESAAAVDRHVLNWAAWLTEQLTGELHVIHAYIPIAITTAVAGGSRGMTAESEEALKIESAFRYRHVERLSNVCGVTPGHLHVEMGSSEACLTHIAAQCHTDVMVMGAFSSGSWHRMLIGSTVSMALEALACDVLIVTPSDVAQANASEASAN